MARIAILPHRTENAELCVEAGRFHQALDRLADVKDAIYRRHQGGVILAAIASISNRLALALPAFFDPSGKRGQECLE